MAFLLDSKVRYALFSLCSILIGAHFFLRNLWSPYEWEVQVWIGVLLARLLAGPISCKFLPNFPRSSLFIMEFRSLATLAIVSAMVAISLVITIELSSLDSTDPEMKSALNAIEKAVTAVVAALIIAVGGAEGASATSKYAKEKFQKVYLSDPSKLPEGAPVFQEGSEIILTVHSDPHGSISGWGFDARWRRAQRISENL